MAGATEPGSSSGSFSDVAVVGIFIAIPGVLLGYGAVALGAAGPAPDHGFFDVAHALSAWAIGFMAAIPVMWAADEIPAVRRRQDLALTATVAVWIVVPALLVISGASGGTARTIIVGIGAILLAATVLAIPAAIAFLYARQWWRKVRGR